MDRRCYRCHTVLPPAKPTGRRQRYCTRACRDAAYYLRQRAAARAEARAETGEYEVEDSVMDRLIDEVEGFKVEVRILKHDLKSAHTEIARLRALVPPDQAMPF
jgi:hypothetical protein